MGETLPKLPLLPIGISDFAKLREDSPCMLYVDKTQQVFEMLKAGDYLFFSRPRRFGKSLLCSTIKYLYQGRRDIFKGLAIEPLWDWEQRHPVLHFTLTDFGGAPPDQLDACLGRLLHDEARAFGVELHESNTARAFVLLLRGLHRKTGRRVVVIVDEYDKSVHDQIHNLPEARLCRNILASFYGAMKGCDSDIEKLFITGVGRMVKTSLFSGFNQMKDLTLDDRTSELCGYTDSELRHYFAPCAKVLAKARKITVARVWDTLRDRYNGYWWGHGKRVYNPWSILNCFDDKRFQNYWWVSGTPALLDKLSPALQPPEDMDNIKADDLDLMFDLDNIQSAPLLWQTGYLTIKKVMNQSYLLGFPNAEVREAWHGMLLNRILKQKGAMRPRTVAIAMLEALEVGDRPEFEKALVALFASIPHNLHESSESFYHAVFLSTLQAVGGELIPESSSDKGRVDVVLKTTDYIYVIEFKLGLAADAMAQIKARRYYEPYRADYRQLVLLAVGGFAERNIQCFWENVETTKKANHCQTTSET